MVKIIFWRCQKKIPRFKQVETGNNYTKLNINHQKLSLNRDCFKSLVALDLFKQNNMEMLSIKRLPLIKWEQMKSIARLPSFLTDSKVGKQHQLGKQFHIFLLELKEKQIAT